MGKSADSAAAVITSALKRYMRHPVVTVAVVAAAQANVLVLGDVKTPGKYALRPGARLTDAVAAAGGFASVNGDLPTARVSMADGSISTVSLQALIHDGRTSENLPLSEGSIVYVEGPQTYLIEVVGAVDRPGNIELHEGDRLSMAIAKAGNSVSAASDLSHVFITRTEPGGASASHEVDMYQALRGGDLLYDPLLRKGDIVYVPQARKAQPALGILALLRAILP
jgi:protein involved in polysaccharide export with SLBB domain